ncbi:hypothetical protein WJX74_006118 [Apatococcus lobatus]|uniref:Uncharacterized protein n=1 Tax=Apatococcus lobatus TaxID=904363 RepID=A0AAW1RLK0_9CHLO
MAASDTIHQLEKPFEAPVYLAGSDLLTRHFWVACAAGFAYQIDPARLKVAAQLLVDRVYPILTSRLRQDQNGSFAFDTSNGGFQLSTVSQPQAELRDVLTAFTMPSAPEIVPVTSWAEAFVEQLDPVGMVLGNSSLFGIRLTSVRDGSILGISASHTIIDAESMGQLMLDLSQLYQDQPVASRLLPRLKMQQLSLQAASKLSDEEIVASLPRLGPAPTSLEEVAASKVFDMMSNTAAERKAGVLHSHHVLHLPEAALDRLRQSALASSFAKEAGVLRLSVHDIVAGTIWLVREAAEGNDLSSGLKKCFLYAVDMRRCEVDGKRPIPAEYLGNAVGANVVMPPVSTPTSSTPQLDDLTSLLAAAACAVNSGTKTLRADPAFIRNSMALTESAMSEEFWDSVLSDPGFSPFRDCAAFLSSWRGGTMDKTDFGHGTPWVIVGKLVPIGQASTAMTIGPGGDGVLCTFGLKNDQAQCLEASKVLQMIAPEAILL